MRQGSPAVDSSQTLHSMTLVLNRDNPVEALRAVALPRALSGNLDFQFCALRNAFGVALRRWKDKNRKGKSRGSRLHLYSAVGLLATSFRFALLSASRMPPRWSADREECSSY